MGVPDLQRDYLDPTHILREKREKVLTSLLNKDQRHRRENVHQLSERPRGGSKTRGEEGMRKKNPLKVVVAGKSSGTKWRRKKFGGTRRPPHLTGEEAQELENRQRRKYAGGTGPELRYLPKISSSVDIYRPSNKPRTGTCPLYSAIGGAPSKGSTGDEKRRNEQMEDSLKNKKTVGGFHGRKEEKGQITTRDGHRRGEVRTKSQKKKQQKICEADQVASKTPRGRGRGEDRDSEKRGRKLTKKANVPQPLEDGSWPEKPRCKRFSYRSSISKNITLCRFLSKRVG